MTSTRLPRAALSLLLSVLALGACGVNGEGLGGKASAGVGEDAAMTARLDGGGRGGAGGRGGQGGTGAGGAGGTGPRDGGTRQDAPGGAGGAPPMDAPVAADRPAPTDTPPAPRDMAPQPGPDTGPAEATIACGMASCSVATSFCCATFASTTCQTSGGCNAGAARRCDGPEDCTGRRACCARMEPLGGYRATCEDGCGNNEAAICHTAADCGGGMKCCAFAFGGFPLSICRASCPE